MTKEDQDYEIPVNTRVSLKGEVADELYQFAHAGSEGWLRYRKYDSVGFPLVFVEWDKDHWAYNGEPDRWAFEQHFDPIEDDSMSDSVSKAELAKAFAPIAELLGMGNDTAEGDPTPGLIEEDAGVTPEADRQYKDALANSIEAAHSADAFLLIAVTSGTGDDSHPLLSPRVFNFSKTREADLLLNAQLSGLSAEAHQVLAVTEIRKLLAAREEE